MSQYRVFNQICRNSLLNLLKSKFFWIVFALTLVVFFFIALAMPKLLGFTIGAYYASTPSWLVNTYTTTIICIVVFSAIVGEINSQKSELIYLLTKNINRQRLITAKLLSTLTFAFGLAILFFLFYIGMNEYTVIDQGTSKTTLFSLDIHWYALLSDFIVFAIFGSLSTLCVYHMRYGVSIIILVTIAAIFILIFPMLFYVDGIDRTKPDIHRLWFVEYGPPTLYLPLVLIIGSAAFIIFIKKRINL